MKVSPLTLEIFFHIYNSPTPLPREKSAGTQETVAFLLEKELICFTGDIKFAKIDQAVFKLTRKGEVWKDTILSTPLPILQYVMPCPYNQERNPNEALTKNSQ